MPSNQEQQVQHKVLPFELKEVDLTGSTFTGYSAAIGNRDLGNDIIEAGAFRKTIKERVSTRYIKLLDNHNSFSTENVWGTVVAAEEVPFKGRGENAPTHKLLTTFEVSKSDPRAQVALQKVAERHLDQLSIGYRALKVDFEVEDEDADEDPYWAWVMGDGVRRIKEIQWWETSLVIWAMNPEAQILTDSLKSLRTFAAKAVKAGEVPMEAVRDAMLAIKMATESAAGGRGDVRRAVEEVRKTLHSLDVRLSAPAAEDAVERLHVLATDFFREHGEDGAEKFVSWVVDNLPEDAAAKDVAADPAVEDDPAVDDAPDATDEDDHKDNAAPDPELPDADAAEDLAASDALTAEVRDLREVVQKLAQTLDAGADEGKVDPDGTAPTPADHVEDAPEAAKDTAPEGGRVEHFLDGDALALTLAELSVLETELAL